MAGAATAAQRQMFRMNENFSSNPGAEARSNRLRDAYNAGQRCFRAALSSIAGLEPTTAQLNDHLGMLSNAVDKEGFMMGWQSDRYAYDNGLQLSVLGGDRWEPEDMNRGYTAKDEGRDVLVESDQY